MFGGSIGGVWKSPGRWRRGTGRLPGRSEGTVPADPESVSMSPGPALYRCAPSLLVLFGVPALPVALEAQEAVLSRPDLVAEVAGRVWGRVETVSGTVHEGFIRWDRNEGSWADVLDGHKELVPEDYLVWNDRTASGEPVPDRVVEYGGYRITFPDHLTNFPAAAQSGIRFGHIRRLEVRDERRATLELKSGRTLDLSARGTDLGRRVREILVEEAGGRRVELTWGDLAAVELMAAPAGAAPAGQRLHGTVRDRFGHEYTGFIAWSADKILDTDRLEGREAGGARREIPFARISTVERTEAGARVTLVDGQSVQLTGPGDVGRGTERILVSEPGLGSVETRWRDVEWVRLHPPARPLTYHDFDGGRPLVGTVVTQEGHELTGRIRWDADEEYSWELLNGNRDRVSFQVEFGEIASIERFRGERVGVRVGAGVSVERERREGARVTLRDGRELELSGSNDVGPNNKGIWVRPDPESEWISVPWEDFKALRLHH